jgi:hypothetical protein
MMHDTAAQVLAQARAAELRDQARRTALARAPTGPAAPGHGAPHIAHPGSWLPSPAGPTADLRRRACYSNPSARTK